jgi:hypothetical protein
LNCWAARYYLQAIAKRADSAACGNYTAEQNNSWRKDNLRPIVNHSQDIVPRSALVVHTAYF